MDDSNLFLFLFVCVDTTAGGGDGDMVGVVLCRSIDRGRRGPMESGRGYSPCHSACVFVCVCTCVCACFDRHAPFASLDCRPATVRSSTEECLVVFPCSVKNSCGW